MYLFQKVVNILAHLLMLKCNNKQRKVSLALPDYPNQFFLAQVGESDFGISWKVKSSRERVWPITL